MSKKDRLRVLAQIWGTPTSRDIDIVDEGDQIVVFSRSSGIIGWWMEIFKVSPVLFILNDHQIQGLIEIVLSKSDS